MGDEAVPPGEEGAAVATILTGAANLSVSLQVGLNGVSLRTLIALPFFLSMLSAKMFLDACEISQSSRRIMVNTSGFWAEINPLPHLFGALLPQLPWKIVASPVQLQVLLSLKSLVTHFADESVRRHQRFR